MATYLTQNTMSVTIDGKTYDVRVPFPSKMSGLLDEQLDAGFVPLLRVPVPIFPPQTPVMLVISNAAQDTSLSFDMEVSADKAEEVPPGSGLYNHELYLIERTKDFEGFILRSHGYVNDLGRLWATET